MENNDEKMTAENFWGRFKDTICTDSNNKDNNKELKDNWNNSKIFTNLILEKLEFILKEHGGVFTEREYFRVDLISYRNKVKSEEKYIHRKLKKYSWNLETAIEHENNPRAWMDEVIKLAHISCDLRVVIGYLPEKHNTEHMKYLGAINEELKSIEAWKYTKGRGQFLVIIGNSSVSGYNNRCVYTAYLYNKDKEIFEPYDSCEKR